MVQENIDALISSARKENRKDDLLVYQAIKNEFVKFKTAKNAKPLDEKAEIKILQKMVNEREETAVIFDESKRPDLAESERYEASLIKEMLPKPPTVEEYHNAIKSYLNTLCGQPFTKKMMGKCIAFVNDLLTAVDGKTLSELVKIYITE